MQQGDPKVHINEMNETFSKFKQVVPIKFWEVEVALWMSTQVGEINLTYINAKNYGVIERLTKVFF